MLTKNNNELNMAIFIINVYYIERKNLNSSVPLSLKNTYY